MCDSNPSAVREQPTLRFHVLVTLVGMALQAGVLAQLPVVREVDHLISPVGPVEYDGFGWALAEQGEILAVATPFARFPGTPSASGAVSLFRRSTTGYDFVQELRTANSLISTFPPHVGEKGVAFAGQDLVIAVWRQTTPGVPGRGAIGVFREIASQWTEVQEIPAPSVDHHLGASIDARGTTMAVGSYYLPPGAGVVGEVRIYRRVSGQWMEVDIVRPSDPTGTSSFGSEVVLGDDILIVSDQYYDGAITDQGAVWVFERVAGTWLEAAKLTSPQPGPESQFGLSLALQGTELIIGQPGFNDSWSSSNGRAFVFRRTTPLGSAGSWAHVQTLLASVPQSQRGEFGHSVALKANRLVIGMPGYRFGVPYPGPNASYSPGTAIYFERNTSGAWIERMQITRDCIDGPGISRFGFAVGLSADWILATVPTQAIPHLPGPPHDFASRVSMAPFPRESTEICAGSPNSIGQTASLWAGGHPAPIDNFLYTGALGLPNSSFALLLASQSTANIAVPGAQGTLCLNPAAIARIGVHEGDCDSWAQRIDTAHVPTNPATAITPGSTWYFQLWHRDTISTGPTSAFTKAISVQF